MNRILLIIQREYLTRVRKKSFLIMTILGPLLLVGFYGIVIYLSINKEAGADKKNIYVSDQNGLFKSKFHNNDIYEFTYGTISSKNEIRKALNEDGYNGVLIIPASEKDTIKFISTEQVGFTTINYMEEQLRQEIKTRKLDEYHIDPQVIKNINDTKVDITPVVFTDNGMESGNTGASTVLGFAGAFLIYLFIFLYGMQIMQGVIEEKTNRIVEVLISSVKPFELMMGKIIGIALVGLTQFVMWVVLSAVFGGSLSGMIMAKLHVSVDAQTIQQAQTGGGEITQLVSGLQNFNFAFLGAMFVFYFISGYLFYGALFAAIGSAIDNETDKQQFMLPATLPLVFAFILAQTIVTTDPNSTLAFWLSIIPFTSPVTMMVRIPFDVPLWEIILSMICMIGGFVFNVWIASRIYRVGILMYGKKPSYKEISKWLFYKG